MIVWPIIPFPVLNFLQSHGTELPKILIWIIVANIPILFYYTSQDNGTFAATFPSINLGTSEDAGDVNNLFLHKTSSWSRGMCPKFSAVKTWPRPPLHTKTSIDFVNTMALKLLFWPLILAACIFFTFQKSRLTIPFSSAAKMDISDDPAAITFAFHKLSQMAVQAGCCPN